MADAAKRVYGTGFKDRIIRNPDFNSAAAELEQISTLKEYVAEAVLLMLDPPTWILEVPTEYDRDTGAPTKFATRPYKYWGGILYTRAGFRSPDGVNVPDCIYEALQKREGRTTIFRALGRYHALVPYHADPGYLSSRGTVLAGYKIKEVDILE